MELKALVPKHKDVNDVGPLGLELNTIGGSGRIWRKSIGGRHESEREPAGGVTKPN